MQSELPWFSHDADARNNPKLQTLRSEFGAEGYGWFWMIVEMLRSREDRCLDLSRTYLRATIAREIGTSVERLLTFVQFTSNECSLFLWEAERLTCPGLEVRLADLDNARARRSQLGRNAGLASAQKRAELAITSNGRSTHVNGSSASVNGIQPKRTEQNRTEQSMHVEFDEQRFLMEALPLWGTGQYGGVVRSYERNELMKLAQEYGVPALLEAIPLFFEGSYKKFGNLRRHLDSNDSFRMKSGAEKPKEKTSSRPNLLTPKKA